MGFLDQDLILIAVFLLGVLAIDVAVVLRGPGSILILKTDHREYYESALELAASISLCKYFEVTATSSDFWADPDSLARAAARDFAGAATSFEDRFRRKRKPIHYLELSRR